MAVIALLAGPAAAVAMLSLIVGIVGILRGQIGWAMIHGRPAACLLAAMSFTVAVAAFGALTPPGRSGGDTDSSVVAAYPTRIETPRPVPRQLSPWTPPAATMTATGQPRAAARQVPAATPSDSSRHQSPAVPRATDDPEGATDDPDDDVWYSPDYRRRPVGSPRTEGSGVPTAQPGSVRASTPSSGVGAATGTPGAGRPGAGAAGAGRPGAGAAGAGQPGGGAAGAGQPWPPGGWGQPHPAGSRPEAERPGRTSRPAQVPAPGGVAGTPGRASVPPPPAVGATTSSGNCAPAGPPAADSGLPEVEIRDLFPGQARRCG